MSVVQTLREVASLDDKPRSLTKQSVDVYNLHFNKNIFVYFTIKN